MYDFSSINLVKRKKFIITSLFAVIFLVLLSGCSAPDYGTKLTFAENNDLYYTENVTAKEAQALGDYLVKQSFFTNGGDGITIQLNKATDIYEFRMVVVEGAEKDQDTLDSMKLFANEISQDVFNGKSLNIHLCDDTLTTLKVVEPYNYGVKLNFGENNELYYTENVTVEEAQSLGDYLVSAEFFADDGNARTIQLNKTGSTYEFRMIVKKGIETDNDVVDSMKFLAKDLSENVFNNQAVDIHLCNDILETLRVVVAE